MKVALVRIGIDSGSGGIQGPLFKDGSFEYLPIPDEFGPQGKGIDPRTYGNTQGMQGRKLIEYFPPSRHDKMAAQSIHFDPEFKTFTYGDPTLPKAGLRHLEPGDLLVFYCGLQGWDFPSSPELYLMGYFEVLKAGRVKDFTPKEISRYFSKNFHVRHRCVFDDQKHCLVLVKGGPGSRLLKKTVKISTVGKDRAGRPLKVLSPQMREIFGDFDGKVSFQRSPTRWVKPKYVDRVARFIRSLK